MTRPSRNTDQKLIQAALELLPETGYSGMKMRAVAKRAGVNLGMFHYYFRSKKEFLERVATEFYEKFYQNFTLEASTGANVKEQLWNAIGALANFGRNNRKLVLALAKDIVENETQTIRMLEKFFPRHGLILVKLIRECQRQKVIANLPLPLVITFMIGSVMGPVIIMAVLEKAKLQPQYEIIKKMILPFMISNSAMEQRMKFAFHALTQVKEREKGKDNNTAENKRYNEQVDKLIEKTLPCEEKTKQTRNKILRSRSGK
jgi:AcrR family transcriptional regulator